MEGLDRAGLAYAVVEPGDAVGTTIALAGVGTDPGRLRALAGAVAPAHRVVVPEPLRFLYLGRERVGQRWYVESIDGEIEPATFGDALYALEQLTLGAHDAFGRPPLLVGHRAQGGGLALALALLMPELLAGVVAVDARVPEVPGWEPPAVALDGLPVLLAGAAARETTTAAALHEAGARVTEVVDADALGAEAAIAGATWWSAALAGR